MIADRIGRTLEIPEAVPVPPEPPVLTAGEIHVWRAELTGPADPAELPSPDKERAERLRIRQARDRFVRSRRLLRSILASYVDDDLRFDTTGQGKPFLIDSDRGRSAIRFNLSHSGSLWMVAVARDREVGVDVERLDRRVDVDRLASRLFSAREREALQALSGARKRAAFLRTWACREAIVKAMGEGMFSHSDRFEVEADPGSPLAAWAPDGGDWPWRIGLVPGPPDRVCVLAVEGEPATIRSWRLGAGSDGP
jgi:4'-phosphopantetheinyl transferase